MPPDYVNIISLTIKTKQNIEFVLALLELDVLHQSLTVIWHANIVTLQRKWHLEHYVARLSMTQRQNAKL